MLPPGTADQVAAHKIRPDDLAVMAADVPAEELDKITYQNAMRWYSFDPYTHITPEQATVGALRKAAEGHDVSIRSSSHHKDTRAGSSFAEFAASAKELTGNQD